MLFLTTDFAFVRSIYVPRVHGLKIACFQGLGDYIVTKGSRYWSSGGSSLLGCTVPCGWTRGMHIIICLLGGCRSGCSLSVDHVVAVPFKSLLSLQLRAMIEMRKENNRNRFNAQLPPRSKSTSSPRFSRKIGKSCSRADFATADSPGTKFLVMMLASCLPSLFVLAAISSSMCGFVIAE